MKSPPGLDKKSQQPGIEQKKRGIISERVCEVSRTNNNVRATRDNRDQESYPSSLGIIYQVQTGGNMDTLTRTWKNDPIDANQGASPHYTNTAKVKEENEEKERKKDTKSDEKPINEKNDKEDKDRSYFLRHRLRLFNMVIYPTLTYASGTWTLSQEHEIMIRSTQRKVLRLIIQTQRKYKKKMKERKEKKHEE